MKKLAERRTNERENYLILGAGKLSSFEFTDKREVTIVTSFVSSACFERRKKY